MAKNKNHNLEFIQEIIFTTGFTKSEGPHYLEKIMDQSEKLKSRTINDFLKDLPFTTRIHLIIQYWTLDQGISSFQDDLHALNTRSPLMIQQEINSKSITVEPTTSISHDSNSNLTTYSCESNLLTLVCTPKRVCNYNSTF